jgi:hypothetical protein
MSSAALHTARHILSCLGTLVLQLENIELGTGAQPPRSYNAVLEELAGRIYAFLAAQTGRVTVGTIKKNVTGRDQWITPALAFLRSQGQADCLPGPRNAQLWATTTEANPAASVGIFGIAK